MQPTTSLEANKTVVVTGLTNQEFLERYARAGRVGLTGGITLVDRAISRAQRHLDAAGASGLWTHSFIFQGARIDGHQWVIESDIQINRRHIRLGAQENRMSKYYQDDFYTTMAVLDFGLPEESITGLLTQGLDLVARRERYSVRELLGTLIALRNPELRAQENKFARDRSMFCSAFVRHLFQRAGIDLAPGIAGKNTTPEDISRTPAPHITYKLQREMPATKLAALKGRVGNRIRSRVEQLKSAKRKN